MRGRAVAVSFSLYLLPVAAAGQVPRGPNFQVNTYTTSVQNRAAVAADAAGDFVVTWYSYGQDANAFGIFARRYEASGLPVGSAEFRVNAYTTGSQLAPAVAAAPGGALIFVWDGVAQDDSGGVYGRRFDAAGAPVGGDFRANAYTTGTQSVAAVAVATSGAFVAVWQSNGQDGSGLGVFGHRFDASATPQGSEFRVNSFTTGSQRHPVVAVAGNGSFVVVWDSASGQDGSNSGVFAQRYDATGAALGPEFRVNTYTTDYQFRPAVAADGAGNFVVVWNTVNQFPGASTDVMARLYDASGNPLIGEFRVNAYATGDQTSPAVASDPAGNFVVAWHGTGLNDTQGVFARRYDGAGAGAEFAVSSITTGPQTYAGIAADPEGNFVVAWSGDDGGVYGIFARQFWPERIFRDDFETGNLVAWSSSATDLGDLDVSSAAALDFTSAGLRGLVDDTAALFVEDDTPDDERRYRVRFHLDPNGFDPGEAQNRFRTRVFLAFAESPTRRVAALVLRRIGGAYALMGRARLDDDTQANTGFFPITDLPHLVEFDLKPAADPDAEDGTFELRIDGVSQIVLTNLDNNLGAVDFARLGALSLKPGANGTLYWDEFDSWRVGFPGP